MKPGVIGILFSPDQKAVLLTKRQDAPIWVLPGGSIDADETPEEALVREMAEETGFRVTLKRQTGHYLPANRWTKETHVFECESISGSCTPGDEVSAAAFFPLDALPSPFFFLHRIWLEEAKMRPTEMVRRPIKEVTLFTILRFALSHPIIFCRYLRAKRTLD